MFRPITKIFFLLIAFALFSCSSQENTGDLTGNTGSQQPLFKLLDNPSIGINFSNDLEYNEQFNIYTYRNFYNGGGVGIADMNNDGLVDIYFTSNMGGNKLYLNKGGLKFQDITEKAGVAGTRAWSTGVSLADVNGDGWIDIYVCNSGDVAGDNKENELFINNGDMTFTESAQQYGVADKGYSTHAAFFDYDLDGDLDLYLLNNSYQAIGSFNLKKNQRPVRDPEGGDRLMRNDGKTFTDVSEEAGIYGSVIGFGLGVTVGDVNLDGWQDLFISNDFFERDYLYINQGDGTFREVLEEQIRSISAASMGADMADINNNGYPDIFVTEMLPEPNYRQKTVTTFENWDKYQYNVENGYYHQFTRNVLHLNNGNSTFSEIGRLAGVEATDWSWGALIFDMDNDGFKDIFVANGIYQDLTDQDYLNFISNEETMKSLISKTGVDYQSLIDAIPSHAVTNYAFRNSGKDYHFENTSKDFGFEIPSFSNGSAYGDLDNDGDLDLVVNNVNMPTFVYENQSNLINSQNHFLKIILQGEGMNAFGIGAKVYVHTGNQVLYQEQVPVKGFESSVDHRLNIGLGVTQTIDSVRVIWPDRRVTVLRNVKVDEALTVKQEASSLIVSQSEEKTKTLFSNISSKVNTTYRHNENDFIDFDRDKLLYHMRSNEGPAIVKGDFDSDGLEDFFIGGAKDASSALMIQTSSGFRPVFQNIFKEDVASEVIDALFFDADGDNDLDLYVAHGGNDFGSSSGKLNDVLYFNEGTHLRKSAQALPTFRAVNSGAVCAGDFDQDGDLDLFVGERLKSFYIGIPGNGFLLENDGKGNFKDVTPQMAPELNQLGMVTDAEWVDVDQDQDLDLVVVGEYMPITIFTNNNGKLSLTENSIIPESSGWWNSIEVADIDNDGDADFIIGNHGLNSRFRASSSHPVTMFVNDFDQNGNIEQVICTYEGDSLYPLVLKHDLIGRIPELKKKYLKYESFKNETIYQIFPSELLERSIKLEAVELASSLLQNNGDGSFTLKRLPVEAQLAPIYAINSGDFNGDGNLDLLLGGNQTRVKPEVGPYDASYGLLMIGAGDGSFSTVPPQKSGISIDGEIRAIETIEIGSQRAVIFGRNNDEVLYFQVNDKRRLQAN